MSVRMRHRIFALLVVAAIFLVGWLVGRSYGRRITDEQIVRVVGGLSSGGGKVTRVLSLIENSYVDSIPSDSIAEVAIPAILEVLDPHSVYIPAREFEQTEEPLQGEFDGIGVVFNMATDTVIVLNVVPSGPSQKAGVQGGDRIIRVNDTLIAGQKMSTTEVMKRLRGKRGTQVSLSLERKGIAEPVEVVVTRDAIPLHSVEAAVMLTENTGFVKLSQFSRTSYAEVTSAVERLRKEGMTDLVLDLRGNSGGFLDQAILIANEFLPKGSLIVYTEDRHHRRVHQFSDGRGKSTDLALAVLIDEGSASSSEILAGALQDNDRGTIIGRRSFGKGLMQSQVPFPDGSALRLTVARYYTPTGRSIQKPYSAGNDDYEMDIINRFNHNEFFSADSIRFADSLRFTTPKGKTVYGGGGIMPDVFMPLDTTNVTKYYLEVSGRNILYRYTIDYADSHRAELGAAKTTADLRRMFDRDRGMFDRFVEYAASQGVKPVRRDIERSREIMEAQLKAFVARNSDLDNSAFYYFIYPIDNTLRRAVEILDEERGKQVR
ncbi:MAG: S41 family peptidase [Alistipes sp.]|nr:S41 family peptidase [Alistipes sp.]